MKCLVPHCKRDAKTRGLCLSHYCQAGMLVRKKKISWKELEQKGKALAAHPGKPPGRTMKWFLE